MALLLAYTTLNSIFAASICSALLVFNWSLFFQAISNQVHFPAFLAFPPGFEPRFAILPLNWSSSIPISPSFRYFPKKRPYWHTNT
jgi:hypothetical protein